MENSFHERNENSIFPSKQTLKKKVLTGKKKRRHNTEFIGKDQKKNTQKKLNEDKIHDNNLLIDCSFIGLNINHQIIYFKKKHKTRSR